MKETKIQIKRNELGGRDVIVINDELTVEQRNMIKYEIYKSINESYSKLIKFLPPNGEA